MNAGKILPHQTFANIMILRWTLALIFAANGLPKFFDDSFGVQAELFFHGLKDDVVLPPYTMILNKFIVPNAFLAASFVKYSEVFIAGALFLGFPVRLAVYLATFLHINYLCIASYPTFIYLNILMIVAEFVCLSVVEKSK